MISIYVKTGCPFCMAVLSKLQELGVDFNEKNIAEEGNLNELIDKGGKRQVPFLLDEEKEAAIFESSDIIDYLNKNYGGDVTEEKESPGVCPA